MYSIEERLTMHKNYWEGKHQKSPLVSYRIGDYFLADKFKANLPLLEKGRVVTADMVDVDAYLEDYERMYRQCEEVGQSAFFTAEPCTAFPWLEAMLGCTVIGQVVSFVTHPVFEYMADLQDIKLDVKNPWYQKYFEFVDKLTKLSNGRFPVGQPIIRGVTDTVGALVGQEEFACSLITDPELTKEVFMRVSDIHRAIIEEQYRHVQAFHGGYAIGFYHLWTPGKAIWYQEDLSLLMSPQNYSDYIVGTSINICEGYDYTLTHLHPASFLHLDSILSIKGLKAVQINKDVNGPTILEMLPECKRVLAADKRLVIFADLVEEEIDNLLDNLPAEGLFFNIVAPTVERARELNEYILKRN